MKLLLPLFAAFALAACTGSDSNTTDEPSGTLDDANARVVALNVAGMT